jgi:hypothetical protein
VLDRLPTAQEAVVIRDVLGILKRRRMTAEALSGLERASLVKTPNLTLSPSGSFSGNCPPGGAVPSAAVRARRKDRQYKLSAPRTTRTKRSNTNGDLLRKTPNSKDRVAASSYTVPALEQISLKAGAINKPYGNEAPWKPTTPSYPMELGKERLN